MSGWLQIFKVSWNPGNCVFSWELSLKCLLKFFLKFLENSGIKCVNCHPYLVFVHAISHSMFFYTLHNIPFGDIPRVFHCVLQCVFECVNDCTWIGHCMCLNDCKWISLFTWISLFGVPHCRTPPSGNGTISFNFMCWQIGWPTPNFFLIGGISVVKWCRKNTNFTIKMVMFTKHKKQQN